MATPAFADGSTPLLEKIAARISQQGPLRFRDYMAMALYDPEHGYYASGAQRVGTEGDFITSVSVGKCFGLILARRLTSYWQQTGKPDTFHIIEPGAHTGTLCADILAEIQSHCPDFFNTVHYHLIEATATLREAQETNLASRFAGKYSSHLSLGEVRGVHGAVIANELLDAFPVDLLQFKDGQWWQLDVGDDNGQLQFTARQPDEPELQDFCLQLGNQFPQGYTTEYNPGIRTLVGEASAALDSGLMLMIDYGYREEEYYHPDRTTGTLQTYHQHRKSENPLAFPGEIDITCHVDFTRLINEAEAAGFCQPRLSSQAHYLTTHAKDWLIGMESAPNPPADAPALLRQFQTLTHPAMLGSKFMTLEMHKKQS